VAQPLLFSGAVVGRRKEQRMHIHGNLNTQVMSLGATQASQQAMATRRAAAEVRRQLTSFASDEDGDLVTRVDTRQEADPDRKKGPQPDDEEFRSIYVSVSA
jgi:hypothetical protein